MSCGGPISNTSVPCTAVYYGVWPYAVTPWIPEVTRPDYRDKPTVMYATLERKLGGGVWYHGWNI